MANRQKKPRILTQPQDTLGYYPIAYTNREGAYMVGANLTQGMTQIYRRVVEAPGGFLPPDLILDIFPYTWTDAGEISLVYSKGKMRRRPKQPLTPYSVWFAWVAFSYANSSYAATYAGFAEWMNSEPDKFSFAFYQQSHKAWIAWLEKRGRVVIDDSESPLSEIHPALGNSGELTRH